MQGGDQRAKDRSANHRSASETKQNTKQTGERGEERINSGLQQEQHGRINRINKPPEGDVPEKLSSDSSSCSPFTRWFSARSHCSSSASNSSSANTQR